MCILTGKHPYTLSRLVKVHSSRGSLVFPNFNTHRYGDAPLKNLRLRPNIWGGILVLGWWDLSQAVLTPILLYVCARVAHKMLESNMKCLKCLNPPKTAHTHTLSHYVRNKTSAPLNFGVLPRFGRPAPARLRAPARGLESQRPVAPGRRSGSH